MSNTITLDAISAIHDADVTATLSRPTGSTDPASDLAARWQPSADQIAAAKFAISTYPAEQQQDLVYVAPIALLDKREGVWTTDVTVLAVEGIATVAWSGAGHAPEWTSEYRAACDRIADVAHEALLGRNGTASYATIHADGTWAVWEAFWL